MENKNDIKVNNENDPTLEKVRLLLEQAKLEERKSPSKALNLAKTALNIANRHYLLKEQSEGYTRIGRCLWILGRFNDAVENLKKGLELAKPLKEGIYEAEALNALGNVHLFMEIYDQAISYYSKALEIAKNESLTELEAGLLNNIGELHKNLHDYDTALTYYKSSLEKYLAIRDDYGKVIPSFNIGDLYLQLNQYEQAEEVIHQVLKDASENDGKIIASYGYHLMGKLHQEKGSFEQSIGEFNRSIEISNETKDQYHQANVYDDLAKSYEKLGKFDLAEKSLLDALNIVQGIDGDSLISSIHSKLGNLYESAGNQKAAFEHFKGFYIATKESEAKRREEKLRSITFQLQLEESQKETKAYRYVIRELENRTEELSYTYRQMRIVGEIGQSITSTLKLETIFNRLYENVNHLMEAVSFGVGLYDSAENAIKYELYIEKGAQQKPFLVSLESTYSWAAWCFNHKKEVMINDVQKEYHKYIEGITRRGGELMNSVIFAPLIIEEEAIGVITVQSPKINAYNENQLDTVKTLASYIAIAVNNAQKSEALQEEINKRRETQRELEQANQKLQRLSEQDGLTGIPNRRSSIKTWIIYGMVQSEKDNRSQYY